MFRIPLADLLTYTNVAYLISLFLTFVLTATLWRVTVYAQRESEAKLDQYKTEAEARISEANAEAALAKRDAASANLAIARLKTPRLLSKETKSRLVEVARMYPSFCASTTSTADKEALDYAAGIEDALKEGGWSIVPWPVSNAIRTVRPNRVDSGVFSGSGAAFAAHTESDSKIFAAAIALSEVLYGPGAAPAILDDALIGPDKSCLRIIVGTKPL